MTGFQSSLADHGSMSLKQCTGNKQKNFSSEQFQSDQQLCIVNLQDVNLPFG